MGEARKKTCFGLMQDQSSCKVWEGSLSKGLGDDAEGSSNPNLELKLGISNIYSSQAEDNHYNPYSGVRFNINQTNEGQANKPDFDLKLASQREDPKRLKVLMQNRMYSRKYRMKKMHCLDEMEKLSNSLSRKISNISQILEETENVKHSLLAEQHQLKLQIEAFHKERILKEAEIEKNMAEVKMLRELQLSQLQAKQDAMHNLDDGLHAVNAQLDLNI